VSVAQHFYFCFTLFQEELRQHLYGSTISWHTTILGYIAFTMSL